MPAGVSCHVPFTRVTRLAPIVDQDINSAPEEVCRLLHLFLDVGYVAQVADGRGQSFEVIVFSQMNCGGMLQFFLIDVEDENIVPTLEDL